MDTVNQNVTNACCWHFDKMSDCVLNLQRLIYFKPDCTLQKVINLLDFENKKNNIIECPKCGVAYNLILNQLCSGTVLHNFVKFNVFCEMMVRTELKKFSILNSLSLAEQNVQYLIL